MNEIARLVKTLKHRLKIQGMTYRDLALALNVSEPSVKRMFALGRFSIDRVIEIAHLLGFTLAELTHEAAASEGRLHTLSDAQERELVSDAKLLLVAVCVLNQWEIGNIVETYALSEAECIQRLVKLDRLRLIDLLPGNRIRLNVARDFDWRPKGPIRMYFLGQGMGEFLKSDFSGGDEVMAFSHAMLTEQAMAKMQAEIRKLRQRFAEIHEESLAAPLAKRRGTGLLLAMREWEIGAFIKLRRK
ncbi:helix-turn-helix domain-containing protein [Propionivibrio sp.]|uniref:helix-turn-helix domain-containing protein n=1 Tax=Propionivibrio sp. TaxID=2212460 RepID=UPI0025CEC003|nr:helix-turn-helix domain-containing protein [Propionivibrio sp.]MBK7357126.1 helix-turn-helix domain-containing protein [Propionivibrio sp.]